MGDKKKGSRPETRFAFVFMRYLTDEDQTGFAAEARIAPSQVGVYDRGERDVPDDVLRRGADAATFPHLLMQPLLRGIRSLLAAKSGWSHADRVVRDSFFVDLLALLGNALEIITPVPHIPPGSAQVVPIATDREVASQLWPRLQRWSKKQRQALLENLEEFRTWALCERAAAESIEAAPSSPSEALELAELALRIAELCPGSQAWRWRLEGYAWFHVGNARRLNDDLPGADVALATAKRLWEAGAAGDPGLLAEAVVLALEARLRHEQRRFSEALRRIDDALSVDRGEIRGKLLLTKAQALEALGDTATSTEVLRQALSYIAEEREPRTALGVRFQFLANLCLEDRAEEAASGFEPVRILAERLGMERDLVRVVWLRGKIAAGRHQIEEAEAAFTQARHYFASKLPYDYALVSLDLALLWLEQNRTAEVRELAEEMAWIFKAQGVHREALAALRIFCDAARRDAASLELARSVVRFLHRAQYDPDLRFGEPQSSPEGAKE